jgi:hypothetical protein
LSILQERCKEFLRLIHRTGRMRKVGREQFEVYKWKRFLQALTMYLVLGIILSSCVPGGTAETQTETLLPPSSAIPTFAFIPTEPTTATANPILETILPIPGEQVYLDPAGQYAIKFPVEWKPGEEPNLFRGKDGYFETGYLPDMGFMSRGLNVCVRLASIRWCARIAVPILAACRYNSVFIQEDCNVLGCGLFDSSMSFRNDRINLAGKPFKESYTRPLAKVACRSGLQPDIRWRYDAWRVKNPPYEQLCKRFTSIVSHRNHEERIHESNCQPKIRPARSP